MLDRRDFIKTVTGTTASLMLSDSLLAQNANLITNASDRLGQLLPQRPLGKTGQNVTILGLGGFHTREKFTDKEAQANINMALEAGVRFFDTAESYQQGASETLLGKILTPKYRDVVYLMTKTLSYNAATARKQLDLSLKRLNTDYLDLWQIHNLTSPKDVDDRLSAGVLEVVLEAKEKGKVRHIGFTGHRSPDAHLRMMEKTDVLQTCQMPINVLDPSYNSFIKRVLPTLTERGVGVLAMKTAVFGRLFEHHAVPDRVSLREMHHFVWSLPVSVLIGGYDTAHQLREKIELARSYTGMSSDERHVLVSKVADLAGETIEYYKGSRS